MEQFKNLMQIMIWEHNRMDLDGIRAIKKDIRLSFQQGRITMNQQDVLEKAQAIYENDLCFRKQHSLMNVISEKKHEEAANASMA